MEANVKRITCDPACGFMVQSHDEQELIEITKKHAKEKHKMDTSADQIKSMMETVKKN